MDYNQLLADRAKNLKPSGIRRFFDIANEMEGVISLGVGEPDFKTPWIIRQAGIKSLERGQTWYTANAGLYELREEIAKYLGRFNVDYAPEDIIVTVGGSEAIDLGVRAFINPGDEVIIPEPSFVCYSPIVELACGKAVPIVTKAEDEFRLNPDDLRAAITDKTKMLIFPFPNNPTGGVMRREHLEEIAKICIENNLIVLSDEIYAELTYGEKHVSIASIKGMKERTVLVNGFSKAYAMTGWRLGYVAAPPEVLSVIYRIHQYAIMCSPTTSQHAAIEALRNCDDEILKMAKEYDQRRRYIVSRLNSIGLDCFMPGGAFYAFPSIKSTGMTSLEFCEKLLHAKKVAVVPGDAFGESGEGYVRISYSYSLSHIKEALNRIEDFLEEIK